jgi:hypothetical protein
MTIATAISIYTVIGVVCAVSCYIALAIDDHCNRKADPDNAALFTELAERVRLSVLVGLLWPYAIARAVVNK